MSAAPRIASPPSSWIGASPSRQEPRREQHADDRLEQHQDPGAGSADEPDAGQEQHRGDRRGKEPGEQQQRHDRGRLERIGQRLPPLR